MEHPCYNHLEIRKGLGTTISTSKQIYNTCNKKKDHHPCCPHSSKLRKAAVGLNVNKYYQNGQFYYLQ
jgi:hypothetical protein